jgi:hypothetical protein
MAPIGRLAVPGGANRWRREWRGRDEGRLRG